MTVIDDPLVAWDGFFRPGKFLKTKGDDWVAYEIFMTPTMSKRVEFPYRWFFDSEMRKEIAQILRDARNDARRAKIGR